MENQDKLYDQFKDAARKAETTNFARMEAVWNRVEDKLDNKKQRRIALWWKYTGIAALFLLFMGVGLFFLNNQDTPVVTPSAIPQNTVTTIDTQAVKETFTPDKQMIKEEVVVEEMPNNIKGRKEYVVTSKNKKATKQPIVFNGTIVDDSGMPVPGVSILVNGKSVAVTTDFDGKFTVNAHVGDNITTDYTGMASAIFKATPGTNNTTVAINSGSELSEVVVEGYRTTTRAKSNVAVTTISSSVIEKQSRRERRKEEKAKAAARVAAASPTGDINIASAPSRTYREGDTQSKATWKSNPQLTGGYSALDKEKETALDEVVVIGYGTQKKQNVTGAVTTVSSETIEGRPNASFVQSLQGQVPGLNVTTGSGAPGSSNTSVILRGLGSLNGNAEPLYVIDGVPSNLTNFRGINGNDIESVSVLKDAAATSVYGNRGANGVVIVKTKDGHMGMTKDKLKAHRKELRKQAKASRKEQRTEEREDRRYEKEEAEEEREQERATKAALKQRLKEKIKIDQEEYEAFDENKFENPANTPLSTFSIDVDNASYTNIRRFLNNGEVVPKDAVRVEEMINFFKYNYPQPIGSDPFSINTEYSDAPWNPNHKLLKIGLQGKDIQAAELPVSNFVFLIDVSGSMSDSNKLPLLKESMKVLVKQMRKQDRIAIVVYAGAAGLVLPSTGGDEKDKIIAALDKLQSGGSTAGGAGIELAYKTALENFVKKGNNRVILATDGDFNVGASSNTDMQTLIEEKRKSGVFLTCLGYGMGNYKDSKLETLADKGNGNYAYIDNMQEADRYLNKEFKGSMYAIAKDVKIQIEFNPNYVQSYRLIGYENRKLRDEDFANDAIDAGELGSGHTVTALYEIIPTGVKSDYFNSTPQLKYSTPQSANGNYSNELATIKFRHKKPDEEVSKEIVKVIPNIALPFASTSGDFKFSAAVAWFGLKLRDSKLVPNKSAEAIKELAKQGLKNDPEGYRAEFIRLVERVE